MLRLLLAVAATAAASQTERVLVTFDAYRPAESHLASIASVLGPERRHWARVERRRTHAPTDFLALRIKCGAAHALRRVAAVDEDRSTRTLAFSTRAPFWPRRNLTRRLQQSHPRYRAIVAPGKEAKATWLHGERGANATVAIFDTGLRLGHTHFTNREPVERINWTSERTLSDTFGHGTFISSLVGGVSPECPGFAPDAILRIHKVFTNQQVSYTSWFLDAFNHVLWRGDIDVINLSVGGPDFSDRPFGDKVKEIVASGITLISAMGNDGPTWGTLNAPGDAVEVVGVGASEADSGAVASISSRGYPLADRVPRMKPDYTAPGMGVLGGIPGGAHCQPNHGTSVASPSIAGVAALVASAARCAGTAVRNPAMVRQCLNEASTIYKVLGSTGDATSMWAQGSGRVDPLKAVKCAETYVPRVTFVPPSFNLVEDCPYLSPLCDQPLFVGGASIAFNVTVLNGLGVLGKVTEAVWAGSDAVEVAVPASIKEGGLVLWPFSGAFVVRLRGLRAGVAAGVLWVKVESRVNEGVVSGVGSFGRGSVEGQCGNEGVKEYWVEWPVTVNIEELPDRKFRLLWDASHSLTYPPAFSPRDNLNQAGDLLDWNGDLPGTNFRSAFRKLRERGYFVDVWWDDLACAPLADYGALLIIDAEDIFSAAEVNAVAAAAADGLGVFVVADWADEALQKASRFFDDNTQVGWTPAVGGANNVALNKLLAPYNVALGGGAWEGPLPAAFGAGARFESGGVIARVPTDGYVVRQRLERRTSIKRGGTEKVDEPQAVLAAVAHDKGRVVVFGDGGCLDDWKRTGRACWALLEACVAFATTGVRSKAVFPDSAHLAAPFVAGDVPADVPPSTLLKKYSRHYDGAAWHEPPYSADPPPRHQLCGAADAALRVVEGRGVGWRPSSSAVV